MSLILSGTDGLSDIDGSAATPAIRGTDANTGIFFPAADTIGFAEGGVEAARFDSAGNLGIGTTSPLGKLNVGTAVADIAVQSGYFAGNKSSYASIYNLWQNQLFVYDSTTGNAAGVGGAISFGADCGSSQKTWLGSVEGIKENSTAGNYSGALVFRTRINGDATLYERARIDAAGNFGLGVTPSAWDARTAVQNGAAGFASSSANRSVSEIWANSYVSAGGITRYIYSSAHATLFQQADGAHRFYIAPSGTAGNAVTFTQAMTLDATGSLLVGNATFDIAQNMLYWNKNSTSGHLAIGTTDPAAGVAAMYINRQSSDGILIEFRQANTAEGSISVSGTTVSYNGGHLSRWAQTTTAKDDSLVKGTVLSNLDAMNVYTDADGNPVDNEQLNKVKVSDTEGDVNVAGVFVNWTHDEQHNVDEINMAMTGDMIIRIAQGTTVGRGDLLMSAGDGTAKPQDDDIVRSKTVAKVTSTHVTCTYEDGSYCVPCVLMAC